MLDARVIKRRRDFTVDVSLQLAAGESLGLFGASGAGKSTVLSCLTGLEVPDDGHVRFGDAQLYPPSLPLHRRPIGYLTQDANLFPHLTVAGYIRFGLHDRDESADVLAQRGRWVDNFRQRLGLARALINNPQITETPSNAHASRPEARATYHHTARPC